MLSMKVPNDFLVSTHPKGQLLSMMLAIATDAHKTQLDKQLKPYILHPLRVMEILIESWGDTDEELLCIAVGHDLIEDTKVTTDYLYQQGMTHRIVEGISALTKLTGEDDYVYIERVKTNWDAIRVKMADLVHNTDVRRGKGDRLKDMARLIRYHDFYNQLDAIVVQVKNKQVKTLLYSTEQWTDPTEEG
jgi:(p)ppGpp synthase/HD superfamily hydrolase